MENGLFELVVLYPEFVQLWIDVQALLPLEILRIANHCDSLCCPCTVLLSLTRRVVIVCLQEHAPASFVSTRLVNHGTIGMSVIIASQQGEILCIDLLWAMNTALKSYAHG